MNLRTLYKALSFAGAAKAAKKGPTSLAKREVRRSAHRGTARLLRALLK